MDKIELYTPHLKQLPVHKACSDEDTFFITIDAGRQSGKTALAQQQALFWALDSSCVVYWVSPTNSQARKVYDQVKNMMIETPVVKAYKGSAGEIEIQFINGSVIKFRSAAQEDTLRGETIDYLIIDEGAFVKESVFQEILLPMLNIKGKKCLVISTPKGKNWFFKIYQKGVLGIEKKYKSFKFTSLDNPYSNRDIIELARKSLPSALFHQEYLAEFVDNTAIFENLNELCILPPKKPVQGMVYFIGVDIALKDDYTVATVLDKDNNVVDYLRFNQTTAPVLKLKLKEYFAIWKPKKIMIEENNQGLPIIQDLKADNVRNIVGFKTTSNSKSEIINNLINSFASKTIFVPSDDIYKSELEVFTMIIKPNGAITFQAENGFHDDIVMSLAIALECKNKYAYSGSYNFG